MCQLHEHKRKLLPVKTKSHAWVICSEISPTTILACHSTEHEISIKNQSYLIAIKLFFPWPVEAEQRYLVLAGNCSLLSPVLYKRKNNFTGHCSCKGGMNKYAKHGSYSDKAK